MKHAKGHDLILLYLVHFVPKNTEHILKVGLGK